MNDCYIFLGPTLSIAQAKQILPDAMYLPPVKCGDISQLLLLKPSAIIIIDGYFEHEASVWHKEILYAMEQGIKVIGASSMGALRAAELAPMGMIGMGEVYQAYADEILEDDDEVAVLHGPADQGFPCLTDAMVNIRATIKKALAENILTTELAEKITAHAKQSFYQERRLTISAESVLSAEKFQQFTKWLKVNYVDLKKLDAKLTLQAFREEQIQNTEKTPCNKTSLLRSLNNKINCRTFTGQAVYARLLPEYPLLQHLALLLSINDFFQQQVEANPTFTAEQIKEYLNKYYFTDNAMPVYREKILTTIIEYWQPIDRFLASLDFEIYEQRLVSTIMQFRTQFDLQSEEAILNWMQEHHYGKDEEALLATLKFLTRFGYVVNSQNTDVIAVYDFSHENWFNKALALTGGFEQIAELLNDTDKLSQAQQQLAARLQSAPASLLYAYGFDTQQDFQHFMAHLAQFSSNNIAI